MPGTVKAAATHYIEVYRARDREEVQSGIHPRVRMDILGGRYDRDGVPIWAPTSGYTTLFVWWVKLNPAPAANVKTT